MFQDYLAKRQPRGFIVEEVLDFMHMAKGADETPLDTFMALAGDLGYCTQPIVLNACTWVAISRPRVFVVGLAQSCGGKQGLTWVMDRVQKVVHMRSISPPTDVWSVISMDYNHTERREHELKTLKEPLSSQLLALSNQLRN